MAADLERLHRDAERRPDDPWMWWRLGNALAARARQSRDRADRAAAVAALRHAAQIAWEGELLGHLASAFAELGDIDLALATIRRATGEAGGASAADYERVVRRLLDAQRAGEALALLGQAGAVVENEDALRLLRAFGLTAHGNADAALVDVDAVLARRPEHADAHLLKARVLAALGRNAECIAAWETAAQRLPGDDEILSGLGVAMAAAGRYDEAIDLLSQVAHHDPTSSDALLNLGMVLRDSGQLDEAEWTVKRALELAPDSRFAHHDLGLVQEAAHRWDEAAASYREAIARERTRARSHLGLARVLEHMGRTQEAVDVLLKARALEPRDQTAQTDIEKLLTALRPRAITNTGAFAGRLSAFPVPQIFDLLVANKSTGRLELALEKGKGELWFRDGRLVRMTADQLPRLAGVIASLPGVDNERLTAALAARQEDSADVPIGRHLLRVGALDAPTLARGREVQVLIALEGIIDLSEGAFTFHKQPVEPSATDVDMDPRAALAEIARLRGGGQT